MSLVLKTLLIVVVVFILGMVALSQSWRFKQDQSNEVLLDIKPMLPLTFAHVDHREQRCVDCHHNYQDDTGQGLCFECHQSDPELVPLMQDQFHTLCRGCHEKLRIDGQVSGPLRQCRDCHTADFLP